MKQFVLTLTLSIFFSGSLWAQSSFGNALSLDGNGDEADIPSAHPSSTFTIEAWIQIDTNYSGYRTIYSGTSGLFLKDKKINWYQGFDSFLGSDVITQFEWHHIAVTYNGNTFTSYIDGELKASSSFSGGQLPTLGVGIGGHTIEYFDGFIDELRIWNFARSRNQIITTMGDTLGTGYYSTSDSGLIGYWRFDLLEDLGINSDGSDDIRDYSIYSNHCDLVGDAALETSGAITSIELNNLLTQPKEFTLDQNFPNPFNPTTTIQFSLPQAGDVTLKIYNVLGEEVKTLVNEYKEIGKHSVQFNANSLASGIYLFSLQAGSFIET